MGVAGQTSVQISVKISTVLRKRLEEERILQGETIAEVVNDALKFYFDYREKRRIEYCQNYEMMKDLDLVVPKGSEAILARVRKSDDQSHDEGGSARPDVSHSCADLGGRTIGEQPKPSRRR